MICLDQTAYIKDKYTEESMRLMQDIIEYVYREAEEAILFSTDTEKAFDSINHNFVFATLEKFCFSPEWVRMLKNGQRCAMNNGKSATGCSSLERGTRQDDPLSSYLFILVVEVLFLQVRSCDNIEGISINESILKLTDDDVYYFVKNIQLLQGLFQIFIVFEEFSYLKINQEK